jgi:hypothetical protein
MPDTGQTMDTTTTFGEDSDYTINAPSYTDNGDGTITDDVTTLVWQKQDDGVTKNWADAITYCDNLTLGGQTNWRLPSRLELVSLIDNGTSNPAVNTTYFPNTSSYIYRTSTKYGGSASDSWGVNFSFGVTGGYMDDATTYVRCVQGGQSAPQSLTDNGNGMVTDNGTHLMWQQGESSSTTWEEALYTCETSTLAGYTDWRLPNFKELLSLVDDTRYRPSNNIAMFPNAISDYYWTSTTYAINSSYASCVFFEYGFPNYINKTFFNNVRCVRGGQ